MSFKSHFSRFLSTDPDRLHFAAHSHHLWPDVSFDAQQAAWQDAAAGVDRKWNTIFGEVFPEGRAHIARILNLPDPGTLALAPSTHELFMRVVSSFERVPLRILSTDGEFHSFTRQSRRLEEAGQVELVRVACQPFETFGDRFLATAGSGEWDLVYLSHVFFDSGFAVPGELIERLAAMVTTERLVVIDGYHAFMAIPTDLSRIADRVFYTAGGYKYAMSGEGVCFLHCPPGLAPAPVHTGWFAGFGGLESGVGDDRVPYGRDGHRFMGATFDPVGVYRLNAVMRLWRELDVSVADIHRHVRARQREFLDRIPGLGIAGLTMEELIPGPAIEDRGHFLTFRSARAGEIHDRLEEQQVITDYRGDRLRFGFGIYHDTADVEELTRRVARIG